MSNLKKLLSKFNETERKIIENLIKKIISLDWQHLDIKKLKGYQDIFRVRKNDIRIIFSRQEEYIFILAIERRRENIYKFI